MKSRDRIALNFSKGSSRYDEFAACQKHAAGRLMEIISRGVIAQPMKILELGCGTGFLTEKLFKDFPSAKHTVTDISMEMLDKCSKKTSRLDVSSKKFLFCDFDSTLPGEKYDMIVSSMSFQWTSDIEILASSIRRHLVPGGKLFISMLVEPTFGSLRRTFIEAGAEYPGPAFMDESSIRSCFSKFSSLHTETEAYIERHAGTAVFLKHLNLIGAGNPCQRKISAGTLRKIIRRHDKLHSFDGAIEAEYRILYGAFQR